LAEGSIRLNTEVAKINTGKVELTSGEIIEGRNIIVATDAHAPFLEEFRMSRKYEYVGGTTLYFSTDIAPANHKMIMLNTASDKLANLVVVMSNINPTLAPKGKHLVAVSINGIPSVTDDVLWMLSEMN
jgi:phytoene dehydrogenase-like protein